MTEKVTGILEGSVDSESADFEEDEIQLSWQRLYLLITAMAEDEGIGVDETTFSGRIEINGDDTYYMRINPAIHDLSGNLETLSLNLYHGGTHVQQIIAKAKWENKTPEITDIDNDPIEGVYESLELVEIANYAESILKRTDLETDLVDIPKGAIFPIPDLPNKLLN